ncbi:hypothetical protein NDU88_005371 [Pleurodeles waltl]|uniref:Uncharacterized protein n=1 Tax=Pleurodeles waltl TaxID=8319 RepID=A0AAV7TAT1_PLEWA|nr:hypothetical protein NDU88_005371 [Pleurodeles waltl]
MGYLGGLSLRQWHKPGYDPWGVASLPARWPSLCEALPGFRPNPSTSPVGAAVSSLPRLGEPSWVLVLTVLAAPRPVGAFGGLVAWSRGLARACARPAATGGVPLQGRLLDPGEACGGGDPAGCEMVVVGSVGDLAAGPCPVDCGAHLPLVPASRAAPGLSILRGAPAGTVTPDLGAGRGLRRCEGMLDTALAFRLRIRFGLTGGGAWEESPLGGSIAGRIGLGSHWGSIWETFGGHLGAGGDSLSTVED